MFRESLVTPVFKKGKRNDVANHRPIAQCSVPCLVMERFIADDIMRHLRQTGQLNAHQHGFVQGLSTETQLLECLHDWYSALNLKSPTHIAYFDFSSAFDIVDHAILLQKMVRLGLPSKTIAWVGSYLSGRSSRVKIAEATLQAGIDAVARWASKNRMRIATHKCAVLAVRSSAPTYTLNGTPLPVVGCMRDLGVIGRPSPALLRARLAPTPQGGQSSNGQGPATFYETPIVSVRGPRGPNPAAALR